MPYRWVVDSTARIVMVRGWGRMELEEILKAPGELVSDPQFDPEYAVLVDLRELEFEPKADDVVAATRNLIGLAPVLRGRIGVVVPTELAIAAELSAAMAGAGGFSVQVFTDPDAARAWLSGNDPV